MVFDGLFKDHILPDRTHMLNVSFLTPKLKREYGGTAANISYNLAMLGGEPVALATVGHDAGEYLNRLRAHGVDMRAVKQLNDHFTAQAFITTDLADNQITAFHPGAMNEAQRCKVSEAGEAAWGIVAPNGKAAMLQHADQFAEAGIPFIFDPGQGLPMFDGAELCGLLAKASALTVNDYESRLLAEKTGLSEQQIATEVRHAIITRGGEGSTLYVDGVAEQIPIAPIKQAVDPTGCGDAYRAGLLFGLARGASWSTSARLGSVLGAIKIEHAGAQNHRINLNEVERRYQSAFGAKPW
jgi:adenosine kinase